MVKHAGQALHLCGTAIVGKHPVYGAFQRLQVLVDDINHGKRVNRPQVVVDKDVAEAAYLAPRDMWKCRLCLGWQKLGGFGQGLEVAQCSVIQHLVLCDIAPALYTAHLGDGVEDMAGVELPRLAIHGSTASRSTCSRMCWFNSCSGTTSTGCWNK